MLVELGKLTCLTLLRDGDEVVLRWRDRGAPILAYDQHKRLHVVYPGKVCRPATPGERASYARTHWGIEGRGKARDGITAPRPLRKLGTALTIQYTTKKGRDRELVDYVHRFEGTRPVVMVHECTGGRCSSRGAIALVGGTYHVEPRGIVA